MLVMRPRPASEEQALLAPNLIAVKGFTISRRAVQRVLQLQLIFLQ